MSDAAFAALNGLRIVLPTGQVIEGKPLAFGTALRLLELLERYEHGEPAKDTIRPLLQEFPAAVQVDPAQLVDLTLGEILDVVRRFFYQRRWPTGQPAPAAGAVPLAAPASPALVSA